MTTGLAEPELTRRIQELEERLRELEQLYATAPVGLCLVDTELRFVRINEKLAAIYGRPRQEHLGRGIRELLPEVADQIEPIYRGSCSGLPNRGLGVCTWLERGSLSWWRLRP